MIKPAQRYIIIVAISLLVLVGIQVQGEIESSSVLTSIGVQTQEISLGDLVADAVRQTAGTPIALIPAGSFREITIPQGKLEPGDVQKCLQYPDDRLVVIEVTGNQIMQTLERSVSIYPQKNLGFVQVSGILFTFDAKASRGSRVSSVMIAGEALQADRKYRVAMTGALADGAYGYFAVFGKSEPRPVKDATIGSAVKDFLSSKTLVDYRKTDRITLKPATK